MLVLGTVYKTPRLRNSSGWLITSLAISDVIMAVVCAPPTLGAFISGRWTCGFVMCQVQGYLIMWLACVSLETMALMSVDRYFRVLHPMKHRTLFSEKRVKHFIVAVWFWACTAPMPYMSTGNAYVFHPGKMFCFHEEPLSTSSFVIYAHVAMSLVILTFCYLKIWRELRANAARVMDMRQLPERRARVAQEDVMLTRTLFVTVLGFLSCWIPVLTMESVAMVRGEWGFKRWVYVMYCYLGLFSSSINPIIYGVMNKTFWSQYKRLFALKISTTTSTWQPEKHGHYVSWIVILLRYQTQDEACLQLSQGCQVKEKLLSIVQLVKTQEVSMVTVIILKGDWWTQVDSRPHAHVQGRGSSISFRLMKVHSSCISALQTWRSWSSSSSSFQFHSVRRNVFPLLSAAVSDWSGHHYFDATLSSHHWVETATNRAAAQLGTTAHHQFTALIAKWSMSRHWSSFFTSLLDKVLYL